MDRKVATIRRVVVIVVAAGIVVAVQALNFTLTVFAYNVFAKLNVIAGFGSLSLLLVSLAIVMLCGFLRFNRLILPSLALVVTLYYTVSIALLFYRIERRFSFDFFFLWDNISDAYQTVRALSDHFVMFQVFLVLILLIHCSALIVLYNHIQQAVSRLGVRKRKFEKAVLLAASALFLATGISVENEPMNVIRAAFTKESEAAAVYFQFFEDSIARNRSNDPQAVAESIGQNVFLIALESVNANLVTSSITPRLLQIAESNGVLFPRIQSSSILSIRAQETFLCSILPALRQSLAPSEALSKGLVCLPKIFKKLGYMTMYFHSFPDINFANIDSFMERIGFDERHASGVMKPTDMRGRWGYGEDIFYKRVFEYLERYKGRKLFVYIHPSINH